MVAIVKLMRRNIWYLPYISMIMLTSKRRWSWHKNIYDWWYYYTIENIQKVFIEVQLNNIHVAILITQLLTVLLDEKISISHWMNFLIYTTLLWEKLSRNNWFHSLRVCQINTYKVNHRVNTKRKFYADSIFKSK